MTLCELATANYQSPPLECASYTLEAQAAGMVATHRLQRDCVECLWVGSHHTYMWLTSSFRALSRSAQFWSSYSGYLREIRAHIFNFLNGTFQYFHPAQLCFVFGRWNDVGTFLYSDSNNILILTRRLGSGHIQKRYSGEGNIPAICF